MRVTIYHTGWIWFWYCRVCGWLSQIIAALAPQRVLEEFSKEEICECPGYAQWRPHRAKRLVSDRDVFGDGGCQLPSLHAAPLAHTRPWCPRAGLSGCVLMELCHIFLMFSQVLCDQCSRILYCGFVCLFKIYIYVYFFIHSCGCPRS